MKKGDIDYEKLYKDSIERAKGLKGKRIDKDGEEVAFMIFPELKGSDKIKAEIIDFFKTYIKAHGCTLMDQWIDWIEKQGEKSISEIDDAPLEDSVNSVVTDSHFKRAEAEKKDFVSGQYVQCRKSFDGFKENESYWFEYIGDDVYIGRSDNILNKKFHITPRQLYRLFSQQHCPKEDNANEETNAPTGYGKYVDECLNEAAKHFFSEGEDTYSVADLFYAGVRCGKSWVEKQGEQKPVNTVESRFKINDKVIHKETGKIWTIHWYLADTNSYYVIDEEKLIHHYTEDVLESAEQKPVEWSEEDEKMLVNCFNVLHRSDYSKNIIKEIDNWLKSIKERVGCEVNCTTKKEWSEEDEKRAESLHGWLDTLINYIHHDAIVSLDLRRERMQQVEQLKTWLKSLKPQNTWSPSDEQMEALDWALSLAKNCGEECSFDLRTLQEQLKKLKG